MKKDTKKPTTKKKPCTPQEPKTKSVNSILVLGIIGYFGYTRYQSFINFIDNLKLDLNVINLQDGTADVLINNLNNKAIPYPFKEVKLKFEDNYLALNNQTKANTLIVPNANLPITFAASQNTTIEELNAANIEITFNWFGIKKTRLYKINDAPETVINVTDVKAKTQQKQTNNAHCCC